MLQSRKEKKVSEDISPATSQDLFFSFFRQSTSSVISRYNYLSSSLLTHTHIYLSLALDPPFAYTCVYTLHIRPESMTREYIYTPRGYRASFIVFLSILRVRYSLQEGRRKEKNIRDILNNIGHSSLSLSLYT